MDHPAKNRPALFKIGNRKKGIGHSDGMTVAIAETERFGDVRRDFAIVTNATLHQCRSRMTHKRRISNGVHSEPVYRHIVFDRIGGRREIGQMREDSETHGRMWKSK
ncbi:MAG: hypothetical protein PHX87_05810 [Candidatus Peribacteraceae bacterium]|nr:hypothetical protein [Candidatus Peribacteraceae bacterium]MDD5742907.1 hypothetical protein [Candidatus Peribacteraceae bacterium]